VTRSQFSLLIDTSILIDQLKGRQPASTFLQAMQASTGLITSSIVVAEALSGARNLVEQREIDRLLSAFRVVRFEPADCDLSIALLRQLKLSHGIGWHDCLIAATAIRLNLPVATLNDRHFRPVPGLQVRRPY
jgi:predicted nucleic acid-binding protein